MGNEQVVAKMQGTVAPKGWSPDGNYIVFEYWPTDAHGAGELWVAPLKSGEAAHTLVRNISSFGTDPSPDGKWLAYTTEESGRLEVYVIPFNPMADQLRRCESAALEPQRKGAVFSQPVGHHALRDKH